MRIISSARLGFPKKRTYLLEIRRRLKRKDWIARVWALWQARRQERIIRREWQYYKRRAEKMGLPDELDEIALRNRLRQRLAPRCLVPKRKGELHIVYATALGLWEKHNIPPVLEKFGALTPFYLADWGFDDAKTLDIPTLALILNTKDTTSSLNKQGLDRSECWLATRHELDRALVEFMAATHARQPVDVLVSYLSGWHIAPETIRAINQMGIATCAFWWDDRLWFRGDIKGGRYTGAAALAAAYDLNLTNASDSIVKYLVEGGLAMFWPEAANPEHFRPLECSFQYDVSFVGACYGQRPAFINYLRRHGIQIEAFGPGWPNGPLSEDEMVEVYARSRINLGISGIGYSMEEMCLKGRDFEVPICEALYLTSEQPDLHRVYEVDREVVTYRNKEECRDKICYLLSRPEECARIRQVVRQRCLREHTWERRFHDLFVQIGVLDE